MISNEMTSNVTRCVVSPLTAATYGTAGDVRLKAVNPELTARKTDRVVFAGSPAWSPPL